MNSLREQFSHIYDEYIEKIYRFVYLKVNSQEIAEDLTSKVFLRCWEAYQKELEIRNPRAFLYQIARNTVIDYYREKGKAKMVSIDRIAQITDPRTDLYEKALLSADVDLIKSAIQNLKKDYQDVIIWHYLDDMSAEQISEVLNRPVGTVRVMIHRGLQALKDELKNQA